MATRSTRSTSSTAKSGTSGKTVKAAKSGKSVSVTRGRRMPEVKGRSGPILRIPNVPDIRVSLAGTRATLLIETVGGVTKTAELLGVSKSQPGRWRDGKESPSPAKARELLDLDHVFARASLLWPREVVMDWMEGPNDYLDGARPIDVLRIRGASEVIEALQAAEQRAAG